MDPTVFRFGDFELDTEQFELRRGACPVKLERKPLELLILLARSAGGLVSRESIASELWGEQVYVDTEHGINTAVRKIRQALRDDSEKPRFLMTITGKGYRLVNCAVVEETPAPAEARPADDRIPIAAAVAGVADEVEIAAARNSSPPAIAALPTAETKSLGGIGTGAGWLKITAGALLLVAAGAGLALLLRPQSAGRPVGVFRSTIVLPGEEKLVSGDRELPLAISPDGRRVAYVAAEHGRALLYVREMDNLVPRPLPGSEDARHPFFSPDGETIGFFANGALKSASIHGGAPQRICNTPLLSMGGSWGADHTIVFGAIDSDLMRVNDSGGAPTPLTGTRPATWPEILPDGKTVLFTTGAGNNLSAFATVPLSGGPTHVIARLAQSPLAAPAVLGSGGSVLEAHVVPDGYLLYGQSPGVIRAVPFDLRTNSVSGAPVPLAGSVERAMNGGGVYFAISKTGVLVYAATGNQHQLVWVTRKGAITPIRPETGPYRQPRLSPDGRLIAYAASDDTRRDDLWIMDAATGARRQLTTEGHNLAPTWSADGTTLAFSTTVGIDQVAVAGGARVHLVGAAGQHRSYPLSWSHDGRNLLYFVDEGNTRPAWMLTPSVPGSPPGRRLSPTGNYLNLQFSPDDRWIAYTDGSSVRPEVYVARAPDLADPVLISTDGGGAPVWSRDGRELFYREGDAVMRVTLNTNGSLHAGRPERLFSGLFSGESHDPTFDISLDGQRFLMVRSDEAASLSKLTVVQNWSRELDPPGAR